MFSMSRHRTVIGFPDFGSPGTLAKSWSFRLWSSGQMRQEAPGLGAKSWIFAKPWWKRCSGDTKEVWNWTIWLKLNIYHISVYRCVLCRIHNNTHILAYSCIYGCVSICCRTSVAHVPFRSKSPSRRGSTPGCWHRWRLLISPNG